MSLARVLPIALVLVACRSHPSPLDQSADPWSRGSGSSSPAHDDDGGFDLQGTLDKLHKALQRPGPYEAPEHSPGFVATQKHWGVITLHGSVVEREAFSLTGGSGTELAQLISRLRQLAKEPALDGLVLRFEDLSISVPDATELRAAMHAFRAAGKHLRCHVENATNTEYLVLTACDEIGLAPLGEIAITGPAAMPIHIKGLLDKLSIQAQFIHIGAYKGAAEPLTLDAPSKETLETYGAILDQRYQTMVDVIASERKLPPTTVQALIDTGVFEADAAKSDKLVDEVAPFETFRDQSKAAWTKLEVSDDQDDKVGGILKLWRFVGIVPPARPTGPHVAVVYALGEIEGGKGDGVIGARQQIASETLVAALRALERDASVKAVVLRVDSPGGSAQASELIWRAIGELQAKKPVIVSMSDLAASGGYYISSGATRIFAMPNTLTGSIGVVGGRIAPAAGLAKLGVATFPMGRGKHATMFASLTPWTPDEEAMVRTQMQAVYDQFVARVAAGRHTTPDKIQPIAQGRVWTGAKAKELGLVDELGGLDDAIAYARKAGGVPATAELEIYPPAPTLRDVLLKFGDVQAPIGLGSRAELAALARLEPTLAAAVLHLVDVVESFATTHVQTVALLPVMQ